MCQVCVKTTRRKLGTITTSPASSPCLPLAISQSCGILANTHLRCKVCAAQSTPGTGSGCSACGASGLATDCHRKYVSSRALEVLKLKVCPGQDGCDNLTNRLVRPSCLCDVLTLSVYVDCCLLIHATAHTYLVQAVNSLTAVQLHGSTSAKQTSEDSPSRSPSH